MISIMILTVDETKGGRSVGYRTGYAVGKNEERASSVNERS
jgi:hypothetical protein